MCLRVQNVSLVDSKRPEMMWRQNEITDVLIDKGSSSSFLSQSHTSGASLTFFIHFELLEITFSAHFQDFLFSMGFGCFFPPFLSLAISRTLTMDGLIRLEECLSASSDLALNELICPQTAFWGFFPSSHLEGEPQMSALTLLTSTCLRCHHRKAEHSSSHTVIREMRYVCGILQRECGKAKDIFSFRSEYG